MGIGVDCRALLVIFPKNKRDALAATLRSFAWKRVLNTPVRILATILGKIRHAGQVIPLGEFLSFFLQENVNRHVKLFSKGKQAWSKYRMIRISANTAQSILILQDLLSRTVNNVWERPIALLIPRDPTFVPYSDACMLGLGGYCFLLDFQWCQETLSASIKKVYSITPGLSVLDASLNDDVHINIYEFIAIIINLYFCILRMQETPTKVKYHPCYV